MKDETEWAATLRLREAVMRASAYPAPALTLREPGVGRERVPRPENPRGLDRLVQRIDPKLPRLTVEMDAAFGATLTQNDSEPKSAASLPTSKDELQAALATHGSVHALARHDGKDRRQNYRWLEHSV